MKAKILLPIILVIVSFSAKAQVGLMIGPGLNYGFGSGQLFKTLNLGVEIPRDENASIIIRAYASLKNSKMDSTFAEAIELGTSPSVLMVNVKNGVTQFGIQGGTRRYFIGSNFDYGFGLYGGTVFDFSLYKLSTKVTSPIDVNAYRLQTSNSGSVFLLSFGLQGGVKKQFSFGTLFTDLSLSYAIVAAGSSKLQGDASSQVSVLNFGFTIGYRKDLFF
ncbi:MULTISPECIES: hypothetical protein [Fluviicola]|uniref:hypothetical protein n=1 Tax=Fluviicola TaxID=332102 RepID=UPI003137E8BE